MIRLMATATLLAASLAGGSALAQGTYQHHAFCLLTGPNKECAYNSMAQCEAAKHGNADQCVRNSAPMNHM